MKPLILLATLAVCAPFSSAQENAPAKTELAQIDPAARDLLARVQNHYQRFRSFESLISWEIGPGGKNIKVKPRQLRIKMNREGHFVVEETLADKRQRRWIYDGKILVGLDSAIPKTYTSRESEERVKNKLLWFVDAP